MRHSFRRQQGAVDLDAPPEVDSVPSRTVSLVIRRDFVHERILNVVVDAVRTVIPPHLLEPVIQSGELKL
ncbi:MAG: hypothetical protein IKH60_08185 [Bacteroidales bacterium]|nr:hypothetical protein [Bacteroidales bacterium]